MTRLAKRLTILALLGTLASISPLSSIALAAPAGGNNPSSCSDPSMKNDPSCMATHKPTNKSTFTGAKGGQMAPGNVSRTPTPALTLNQTSNGKKPIACPGGQPPTANGSCPPLPHKPNGPPNGKGNGTPNNGNSNGPGNSNSSSGPAGDSRGFFNFSPQQHDQFRQRFRSFNFGQFAVPTFGISLGIAVPRSYGLRPLPSAIYRYYPYFRGYLYFVLADGRIVIVNPRTFQIVAII